MITNVSWIACYTLMTLISYLIENDIILRLGFPTSKSNIIIQGVFFPHFQRSQIKLLNPNLDKVVTKIKGILFFLVNGKLINFWSQITTLYKKTHSLHSFLFNVCQHLYSNCHFNDRDITAPSCSDSRNRKKKQPHIDIFC